jgi:hypothetical protein
MTQDEHRAPGRLAPSRSDPRCKPKPPSHERRVPSRDYEIIDQPFVEGRYSPPAQVTYEPPSYRSNGTDMPFERAPAEAGHAPLPAYEAYPQYESAPASSTPTPAMSTGEMSRQEQYQLLIHNIQLRDDEWKLLNIRANSSKNWLVAYLVPRNKQIDLKKAISTQQVLTITIDARGNTEVREPQRRSLPRRLFAWVFGG